MVPHRRGFIRSAAPLLVIALLTGPASADSPDGELPLAHYLCPAEELAGLGGILSGPGFSSPTDLTAEFVLTGSPPEGDTPSGVAFTPDGSSIVVAHRDTRNLIVFDANTRSVLMTIQLSGSPGDLAVSSDGVHAVTANVFENTVSIVDLTSASEVAVVPVGTQPGIVRITPDGSTAVVANTVDATLSIIDIGTASETRRVNAGGFLGSVSISFESGAITAAFGSFELAGNSTAVQPDYRAKAIHVIDLVTGAMTTLPSSANPRAVAVTPDGATAVVSHTLSAQVISVVDVAARTITKTIAIGADLFGPLAVDPNGLKAVVAVQNACRVVNLSTNAVSASLATASVNQLHTTADGNYAQAVGFRGSLIDYSTETIVNELNNIVSTAIGAVSPTGPRAVMVANVFGEDMLVVNTNGAAGFIEEVTVSGPPPEGDKARTVAVSPDGSRAVVSSILSDNASIVDLTTLAVEAIVEVGDRPSEVAITPDGSQAVVANLDSPFVSVIDLASQAVTDITISTRGSQVEISPDGHYAYVAVVTSDGVWRIDLQTLTVAGPKLTTGDMGGILYLFGQSSGMTLSHDGATLVTVNSFSNSISIVDTALWSVVATVPTGAFPVRATFTADDSTIYVANRNDDAITAVQNSGGSSGVIGSINVGDWPFEMVLGLDGNTLYVANFQDDAIGVVDLAAGTMVRTIALPDSPAGIHLDETGTSLYAATGTWSVSIGPGPAFSIARSGQFSVIDTATELITDQVVTGLPPAMLAVKEVRSIACIPSPFGDGLTVIEDLATTGIADFAPAPRVRLALRGPNPFSDRATLRYTLPAATPLNIMVHDVSGRRVITLVDGTRPAGDHEVSWDGRNARGDRVPAGIYVARLVTPGKVQAAKLVVVP